LIAKCPECDVSLKSYEQHDEIDFDEDVLKSYGIAYRVENRGCDALKIHPKLKKSQTKFLQECDGAYPEPIVPSSKTTAVKDTILKWQSDAPDDKIIVFTEFKMTGGIIGRMLDAEGIPFLYFYGDMSQEAKQNALHAFEQRKEIKVLVSCSDKYTT
jgi:SNF2 family DNA or RNA helicase